MTGEDLWIQIGRDALLAADQILELDTALKLKKKLNDLLALAQKDPRHADLIKMLLEGSPATREWARNQANQIIAEQAQSTELLAKRVMRRKLPSVSSESQEKEERGQPEDRVREPDERVWRGKSGDVKGTKAFATIQIYYGTDRKPTGSQRPDGFYAAQRGELALGSAKVSIPHDHRMGELEGPSLWKLEFVKDPSKHVVLLSLDVLSHREFVQKFRSSLSEQPGKQVLLFVHGYNVSFEDACRRTAQIAYDLKFVGVPVTYSWPSESDFKLYLVDETNVHWSVPHFRKFLSLMLSETGAEKVHVIAHSMGNRVLVETLRTIDLKNLPAVSAQLTQVIFAAPDIDAATFQEMAEEFCRKASRLTLYASSKDLALMASKALHKHPRAGDSGEYLVMLDGLDTIDATEVDTGLMGHSYIGDNDSILADVYDLIRDGSPPANRFRLRRRERTGRQYWMFQA